MIRLDNISKQNGHQILFIDASMGIQKGEKVGLVGPNGAGKTTLFRMIAGEDRPDDGQVTIDPGMTIGYFSQDVGEMSGQSAVAAVMDGVGPVSALAIEMAALEAAMVDPDQADDMETIVERYGEVQGRFQELDGYALEARAREVLAGLSFSPERMDGDVGLLSGGWKMRVALARILLMRPDAMLLDEPSNHLDLESLICWLAVGPPASIADGRATIVAAPNGERIAIYRDGATLGALTNLCAHQNGPLGEGRIIDGCVTCPWHGYQYRLEDGCAPPPFTEKLATYRLRLSRGVVEVNPRPLAPGTPAALICPSIEI
jgi:ABC-type Mn2+/Zn2+ transport system ATPase subunit/nitrite reductase/ring-hydroxylating ferredoxin subunit